MPYFLTKGGTSLELPPDLLWADELHWNPVKQETERSITGALIVDVAARVAGRPITLQGTQSSAFIARADLLVLRQWLTDTTQVLTLSIHGEDYAVLWDHGPDETSRALQCEPVVDYCDPEDADYYCSLVLRFLTQEPVTEP